MTGNATFPLPFPANTVTLANATLHINALDSAETALTTKPPTGTTQQRDAAKKVVTDDMESLRLYVQTLVNASPAQAETIAASAGMTVKAFTNHGKQKNTAKDGAVDGSVILTAEGTGPHEWRSSTDGTIWTAQPSSRTSKTTIAGLISGTKYFFQNRQMLTNGAASQWSQSVSIRVN